MLASSPGARCIKALASRRLLCRAQARQVSCAQLSGSLCGRRSTTFSSAVRSLHQSTSRLSSSADNSDSSSTSVDRATDFVDETATSDQNQPGIASLDDDASFNPVAEVENDVEVGNSAELSDGLEVTADVEVTDEVEIIDSVRVTDGTESEVLAYSRHTTTGARKPRDKTRTKRPRDDIAASTKRSKTAPAIIPIPVCITGGSGELALAIAKAFASHPVYAFQITLVGRSKERLQRNLDRLPKSANPKWPHKSFEADVTKPDWMDLTSIRWTLFPAEDHPNTPAILVNCAGAPEDKHLSALSAEDIVSAVQLNLTASIFATKGFIRRGMRAMRSKAMQYLPYKNFTPSIINVGSILGQHGGIGVSVYAAAKAGLVGFTRASAAECGRMGIRVNAVLPGPIDSRMARKAFGSKVLRAIAQTVPLGRLANPAEVADAVLFLALNNYANNCVLNLDGGLSAVGPMDVMGRLAQPISSPEKAEEKAKRVSAGRIKAVAVVAAEAVVGEEALDGEEATDQQDQIEEIEAVVGNEASGDSIETIETVAEEASLIEEESSAEGKDPNELQSNDEAVEDIIPEIKP